MRKQWIGCAQSNFRPGRPQDIKPEVIVVHIIVGSLKSADNTFLNSQISPHRSAHYAIGRDGTVHQYVLETDTAFHAGVVDRPSATIVRLKAGINPNLYSVGIEHEGFPGDEWPTGQVETSAALISEIAARWGIPCDREHVIRHHEIRASKTCPGLTDSAIDALVDQATVPSSRGSQSNGIARTEPGTRVIVGFPRRVRIIKRVNLRSGPSVTAPIVAVIPPATDLAVTAIVAGESPINGILWWYELAKGGPYFWSGAAGERPGA